MAQQRLMKDGLGLAAIQRISAVFAQLSDEFNAAEFEHGCLDGLQALELKERVQHIITVMHQHLGDDFEQVGALLLQVKNHWDYGDEDDALSGFAAWPVIDYVAVYGQQHVGLSLQILAQLTPLFSAEYAIRHFIVQHYDVTVAQLLLWTGHENEHVRRLASEGSRPRLPWGIRLDIFCQDPQPLWPILDKLKNDPSLYVRRSVANSLNDIAKDNPDWVIACCKKWQQKATKETLWVIKHATRSLVKDGHPQVFSLLGYTDKPEIEVSDLNLDKQHIQLGEAITFSLELHSQSEHMQNVVVDYAVYHQKANGKTSRKVFKLKTIALAVGERLTLKKKQLFKAITTRKYYSGVHRIEILINGVAQTQADFILTLEDD